MSKRNVVHIEIPAADQAAAGKFYGELFGWKITPMPEMNYTMWDPEEGPGGGFPGVSNESPAGQVTVYFDSEDIEADLKKIVELGGSRYGGATWGEWCISRFRRTTRTARSGSTGSCSAGRSRPCRR